MLECGRGRVVFPKDVEIIELREVDEDGVICGGVFGYYAKGQHDLRSFAIAANKRYETAAYENSPVCVAEVKVGFLRIVPRSEGFIVIKSSPGAGAFLATYCFF